MLAIIKRTSLDFRMKSKDVLPPYGATEFQTLGDVRQDDDVNRGTVAEMDGAALSNFGESVRQAHFDIMMIEETAIKWVHGFVHGLLNRK